MKDASSDSMDEDFMPLSPKPSQSSEQQTLDRRRRQQQQQKILESSLTKTAGNLVSLDPSIGTFARTLESSSSSSSIRSQDALSSMQMIVEEEETSLPRKQSARSGLNRPRLINSRVELEPCSELVSPEYEEPLLYCFSVRLTSYYSHTCPSFSYSSVLNPRRVLTRPHKHAHNDGADNENWDLICYVGDTLGEHEGGQYQIIDLLGQGTFGQVFKCVNRKTRELVAVKVIKNKPAYYNQSLVEVAILDMLNNQYDTQDVYHIGRMRDTFVFRNHLCITFELLSVNLYELVKQNQFRGLSTNLVRVFVEQILDALCVLNQAKIIHCDLKPENILLKSLESPSIKIIDFGSACHENQTVYTYIQSRFYRAPEVLLSLPYTSSIDMWSVGCIAAELFLGLPLFPGSSEYNQICRIVEMLGNPPAYMLDKGKSVLQFFVKTADETGHVSYRLKTIDEYNTMVKTAQPEAPSKRYFQGSNLSEIISRYPLSKKNKTSAEIDREMLQRRAFLDFLGGLLHLNPMERWSPYQAKMHPFITGEAWNWTSFPSAGPYLLLPKRYQDVTASLHASAMPSSSRRASVSAANLGGVLPSRRFPATFNPSNSSLDLFSSSPTAVPSGDLGNSRTRAQTISSTAPSAVISPHLLPLLSGNSSFSVQNSARADDGSNRLLIVPSVSGARRGSVTGQTQQAAVSRLSPSLSGASDASTRTVVHGRPGHGERSALPSRAPSISTSVDWDPFFDIDETGFIPNSPGMATPYGFLSTSSFRGSAGGSSSGSSSSLLRRNSRDFAPPPLSTGIVLSPNDTSRSFLLQSPRLAAQEYAKMTSNSASQERLWPHGGEATLPASQYPSYQSGGYPPNSGRGFDPLAVASSAAHGGPAQPLNLPLTATTNPQIMTFMGRRASAPNVFQMNFNRHSGPNPIVHPGDPSAIVAHPPSHSFTPANAHQRTIQPQSPQWYVIPPPGASNLSKNDK